MTQMIQLSAQDDARFRRLIEVECQSQRVTAVLMGWPRKRVKRLVKRLGLKTRPRGSLRGDRHPCWKGGRTFDKSGYVMIYKPSHPHARGRGYVREHRLVMEAQLGRYLTATEVVDHVNGVKDDNRPENLRLYAKNADHLRETLKGKCPQWTEDGKRRMREKCQRVAEIARLRKASDESACIVSPPPSGERGTASLLASETALLPQR